MGLGTWLGDRTGIHPTAIAHKLGGVLDNGWTKAGLAAALAATGVGTPAAMALMAGEGMLGGALHEGGGLRDAFTGGVKGAGYGAAAGSVGQAWKNAHEGASAFSSLRSAFSPSSAGSVPNAGGAASYAAEGGGMPVGLRPPIPTGAPSAGFSMGNAAKGVGSFLKENPTAVSMGLQGAGNIASAGAQNELARAQAHRLDSENSDADYELQRKKRRDLSLDPIRQMLMGQLTANRSNKYGIAPNPYTGV